MALPNIYIRKVGDDKPTYELREQFGIYAAEMDFPDSIEVKDVEKNDFFDENGDEEKDTGRLYAKSHEMNIKFNIKGTKAYIYDNYSALRNYLLGVSDSCTKFMLYDGYHGIGRTDMRLVSIGDKAEYIEMDDDNYMLQFTVKVKINDPLTDAIYDVVNKKWSNLQ